MSSSLKVTVVTGGTGGMGRAVALDRLDRGERVIVIGRDPAKGRAFLAEADALGAAGRATFLAADLSGVAETRAVIERIRAETPRLDALVLAARHYRTTRAVTDEGFEHNFALFYLSRFLFSHGLLDLLNAAERPVILNVSGPGAGPGEINWDDLGFESGYHGARALAQGGPLNDLLGVAFARHRAAPKVAYVLLHPGTVNTGFSGEYDAETAAAIEAMRPTAQPIDQAIRPMLRVLDDPPAEPLTAIALGRPLDVTGPEFDEAAATRLFARTGMLLGGLASAGMGVAPDRLRRLLDTPVHATVATVQPDGSPHQSVVWIDRDGDDLLFSIAVGSRKERNLRRDPRVSVLVSPPDAPHTYAAIHGTATLAADDSGRLRDRLSLKYTGRRYGEHNAEAGERYGHLAMAEVRVTPEKIVGRL